jgi:hypothetical protein
MSSLLTVAPSTIVARLATGDLKDATPAEITTLLSLDAPLAKLSGIEALADVTDEANVTIALNGATPGLVTPLVADSVFIQDDSDSDNLKLATISSILNLANASKNILFNGNFDIWQRGFTFTGAVNIYTADRWAWRDVGAGVVDILRSTDVPNGFSDFSLHVDVTTADAALATTDFYGIEYRVEGQDALQLALGTADAETVTLSFWVKSAKTGIHSVALQNSAINRSYVAEYTVAVADTWELKSVTIVLDTSGTWLTDTGIGLAVLFALASGPDRDTTPGTWQAGDFKASTNQVNVMDNATNNFRLSQVQLEIGTTAGPFAARPFAQELNLCKRYFQKTFPYATAPAAGLGSQEGSIMHRVIIAGVFFQRSVWSHTPQMRLAPSLTFFNPGAAGTAWYNFSDTGNSGVSALETASNEQRSYISNPQVATDGVSEVLGIQATADSEL